MGERWDAAVAVAGEEPRRICRRRLARSRALWSDLGEALRRAAGRRWPVECDGLVVRIVMLSRLASATPWPHVPKSLLADGIYQGILRSAGVMSTPPGTAGTDDVSRPTRPGSQRLPTSPHGYDGAAYRC
jgi:hypothetical protein